MSDTKQDGGPAFPCVTTETRWETIRQLSGVETTECKTVETNHPGMSLRDYFIGQALAGLCANPGGPFQANGMSGWGIVNTTEEDVATICQRLADAMLKARER